MKKRSYLLIAAALALASCSQDDLMDNGMTGDNGNAITFESYLGKSAQSRATVVTTESLKKEGFTVDAYYTGTDDFSNTSTGSEFMKGTKVTYNEDKAAWTYSPLKYWPNNTDDKVSFFAYGPYGNTNIVRNTTTVSSIDFTVQNDVRNQVDFIYNKQVDNSTLNQTKPTVSEKVKFQFQHALSRIGFTVAAAVDETSVGTVKLDGNSRINVKKVALVSGDATSYTEGAAGPFYTNGTLDMLEGKWSDLDGAQSFTLAGKNHFYRTVTDKDVENSTNDIDVVQLHKFNQSQRLLNDSAYVMIIPTDISEITDAKTSFKIYIEYDVITEDDDNADVSKITNKILSKNALDVTFEAGKAYNFNLILGMTSVKFDVDEVVDWNNADSTDEWLPENESAEPVWDEESGTFLIYNATQLASMRDKINNDESYNTVSRAGKKYAEASYKQMADIDLSGFENWIPIGNYNSRNESGNKFQGCYDGCGFEIKNLQINSDAQYVGLFGYIYNATIKNVTISSGSVTSSDSHADAGGIVGYASCSLNSMSYIINCKNSADVTAKVAWGCAGGISGGSYQTIIACVNTGNITGASSYVGGIAARTFSEGGIYASYNTGTINSGNYAGGIVGSTNRDVVACYSRGKVPGGSNKKGGVVGEVDFTSFTKSLKACFYSATGVSAAYQTKGSADYETLITDVPHESTTDWSEAMNTMNQALARLHKDASDSDKKLYNWHYVKGSDSTPLTLETGCVEIAKKTALKGKGTEQDPYQISDAEDLKLMVNFIKNQTTPASDCKEYNSAETYYLQVGDIDFKEEEWDLIVSQIDEFCGNFDGGNYEMKNFELTRGLIYTNKGTLKNIHFTNANVVAASRSAIHDNYGKVINCSYKGKFSTKNVYEGALVGRNYDKGIMIGCSFNGTYTSSAVYNGPIAGNNYSYMIGCYSSGSIIGTGSDAGINGIANEVYQKSIFIGCYTTAEFTAARNYIYPIACDSDCKNFKANYNKATTTNDKSFNQESSIKIDGTTVTWASAVDEMNAAISDALKDLGCGNFKYVENTDNATKQAWPYVLKEIK